MLMTSTHTTLKTLGDLLAYRNRETPNQHALHFGGEPFTFGKLYDGACRFAALLQQKGCGHGDRVVL